MIIKKYKSLNFFLKISFLILLIILMFISSTKFSLLSKIYKREVVPPVIINSVEDFELIRNNVKGNFELGKDISFPENNWIPINGFEGNFDGRYHKLSNINININAKSVNQVRGVGIFGSLQGGSVKNLVVENMNVIVKGNVRVEGISFIVGFVDWAGGSIHRCTVTGNITYGGENELGPYDGIGGICGRFAGLGSVTECAVRGNITMGQGMPLNTGSQNVGMIVGSCTIKESYISDCYSSGTVQGTNNVGGLVGLESESQIKNCYSTVNINYLGAGTNNRGGIIGWSNKTLYPVDSCYYDYTVNNWATTSPNAPEDIGKGIPKNPYELTVKSTFKDWDFESVWIIDPSINDGMPWLRWIDYDFAYGGGTKQNDFLGDPYWTYNSSISNECFCVFKDFLVNPDKIPKIIKIEFTDPDISGNTKIKLPSTETTKIKFTVNEESTDTKKIFEISNINEISQNDFDNFIRGINFFCESTQEVNINFKTQNNTSTIIRELNSKIENPMRLIKLENDVQKIENFLPNIYEYKILGDEDLTEITVTPKVPVPNEVYIELNNKIILSEQSQTIELIAGKEETIIYITLKLKNNLDCVKTYELNLNRPNIISVIIPTKMYFQVATNYPIAKFICPIYKIYNNSKNAFLKVSIDSLSVIENGENPIILEENDQNINKDNIILKFKVIPSFWVNSIGSIFNNSIIFPFTTFLNNKELGYIKPKNNNGFIGDPFYGEYTLTMDDRPGYTFEPAKEYSTNFNLIFNFEKVN